MNGLFTTLTEAMMANFGIAVGASLAWGILSILLSPCHLSSIPLIVGFLSTQSNNSTRRTFTLSATFAIGILVMIAVVGAVTAMMGRMMGDVGQLGKYLVAIVFIIVGLYLMDLIRFPDLNVPLKLIQSRFVHLTAFVLGLVFGFALGPCTFAFMAPVLGIVFQLADTNILAAGSLLLAFAIGHCAVIVIAGVLATRIQSYLDWSNQSKGVIWMKRIAGGLVILGGVYAFTTAY